MSGVDRISMVAAILAVPWSLIGTGTSPTLRHCIYFLAAALTCIAVYGALA